MTRSTDPRSRRLFLVAAVSGICAAALAAPAGADDGPAASIDVGSATVVVPAVDTADATLADAALQTVAEIAAELDVPEPEDVVEEPAGESGSRDTLPAPVEPPVEDDATSPTVPEQASATGAVPSSDAGSTSDTTVDSGDTAPGSTETTEAEVTVPPDDEPSSGESTHQAAAPSSSASPAPSPVPAPAMNVNVSVRVGSAGDNGAVTQVNTAATTGPASKPQTTSGAPTTASPAAAPTTQEPTSSAGAPAWYWEWDCLSAPEFTLIPTGSTDESVPTSWTWIWNCADNSEQYRDETPDQYQQINTNISIRISSPGDNGPVTQTNVTAAVAAALPPAIASPVELPSLPSLPTTTSPISIPALPALELPLPTDALPSFVFGPSRSTVVLPGISLGRFPTTSPAPRLVVPSISFGDFEVGDGEELGAADVGLQIDAVVEIVLGSMLPAPAEGPLPPAAPAAQTPTPAASAARPPRGANRVQPHVSAPVTTTSSAPVATPRIAVAAEATAPAGPARATRPASSWKRSDSAPRPRAPVQSPSGTSASAASGGGSGGGGLPIFLALPFLVAVLDLARRVAQERVTWPSGHRRRVPDTPG
ncbi:MAG TPA: hypothetical protein VFN99_03525 [Gaiella sp.]|nr:hypothetical protein [Gaiella sp.]